MFDIGFWEILLIAIVALIVVGPERLPKLVRVTGLWIGRAQSSLQSIRNEISKELRAQELKDALRKPDNMPDLNENIPFPDNNSTNKPKDKNQDG
ncbi:Sec-independent protein translocase protein TatB [Methylophaga sp.]|uniref:Sec-independent protein translocase protein TatB n=1 Tax=Methylophaga sp. TaxID=2024840 RepID=UPI003F69CD7C